MAVNDLITRLILQTKEFDGNLKRSEKEMKNFQKEISSQVGNVSKGFSSAIGVVGKLAPAIGIAAGGVETFKKVIASTKETQDAFNKVVGQAKAGIDTFFQSIARADFSNFTEEMSKAIKLSGDFEDAIAILQQRQLFANAELSDIARSNAKINADIAETKLKLQDDAYKKEKGHLKLHLEVLQNLLNANAQQSINVYRNLQDKATEATSKAYKAHFRNAEIGEEKVHDIIKASNEETLNERSEFYKKMEDLSAGNQINNIQNSSAGAIITTTYEETPESKAAKEWLNSTEGKEFEIYYKIKTGPEFKEALDLQKKANDSSIQADRIRENLANKELEKENVATKTITSKVDKQKELYQSYNLLITKVGEYRVAMAKASEVGDTAGIVYWRSEMEKAQAKIDELKAFERNQARGLEGAELKTPALVETADSALSKGMAKVKEEMNATTSLDRWDRLNEKLKELTKTYEKVQEANKSGANITSTGVDLDSLNKDLSVWADKSKAIGKANYDLKNSFEGLGDMGAELTSLSSSISSISDNPQIRALAMSLMILTGVQKLASATTWIEYVVGGISVAATVASMASSFANAEKFAGGGIVGDKNLVRINEGEMILNHDQQTRLFNSINSGRIESNVGGQVEFVLRGQDLIGVQKNYNKKFKK